MSVFCNLGRPPWVYRAFSYQRLFADAEKGPMQIALGQSDICEFESYMPSHAVRSLWGGSQPLQHAEGAPSLRRRSTSLDHRECRDPGHEARAALSPIPQLKRE